VAQVRRRKGARREEYDDCFPKRIGGVDRHVESRIVDGALRALHPVHDASSVWVGLPFAANGYARIACEFKKLVHVGV
jgi:hypothetical protein